MAKKTLQVGDRVKFECEVDGIVKIGKGAIKNCNNLLFHVCSNTGNYYMCTRGQLTPLRKKQRREFWVRACDLSWCVCSLTEKCTDKDSLKCIRVVEKKEGK